jgi:hypothetical protein
MMRISRVTRATELRVTRVELDEAARRFVEEAAARREIRIIPNEPHARDVVEYAGKVHEERKRHLIPPTTRCCSWRSRSWIRRSSSPSCR